MANRLNTSSILIGLFLLLAGLPARSSPNSDWFTRVWQIDDGLLDNDINSIVQGPNNYLWLVTPEGVMQFDGVNFTPFMVEDNGSARVRKILCGRTGVIWMACDNGKIIGINRDFSTILLDASKLPPHAPLAMASDRGGTLWLGYPDAIYRVQNGQITKLTAKDGVPPGMFRSLTSDGVGNIWLAEGSRISYFRDGTFQNIATVDGLQGMAATDTNALWLVAGADLYFCNTNGHLRDCGAFQNTSDVRGVVLLDDQSGAVWIGTSGNGLFRYYQSNFERMDTSHSFILSLAKDHEGNIWVGTGGGGLDRITPCGIRLEGREDSPIPSQIQSICQDDKGVLWGATENGMLLSLSDGVWKPVFTNAPFAGKATCVAANHSGIWVGTRHDVLLKIIGTNFVTWQTNFAKGLINGLLPSPNGDLWIVGIDAVQHLHRKRLSTIKLPRQVQRIYAIGRDVSGSVWVGADNLLLRFDGTNMFNVLTRLDPGRTICCLCGTSDGSLWIGSSGGGLMRFKNGRLDQIGLDQGLVSDYISQIVADNHGWLWVASKHGIFKLQQREVERAMEDHSIVLRPITYGKNEGLISQEAVFSIATPFILPHAILSSDGHVWMLMRTGVVVADPDILSESLTAPPILLTEVAMDGQIVVSRLGAASGQFASRSKAADGPLRIPPSHRHLEFDFTAFHFKAPENLHFRYQLMGYDSDWINAGNERSAAYSRLATGDYQFRVEACVSDGPWSNPAAVINFTVVSFFWQTWWFRVGVVLLFTFCVFIIARYISIQRIKAHMRLLERRAELDKERTRIARDLHDDLGCSLNKMALSLDMMQKPNLENGEIQHFSTMIRSAAQSVDEIIWTINPRNDTLRYVIDYISQSAVEFLHAADILCVIELPDNIPNQMVSPEVRHNLLLVVKEALNNIARHARATEVRLNIVVSQNHIAIAIEDNGCGFENAPDNASSDGLRNMRERMEEISGEFRLESRPGAGTRIVIHYPSH